MTRYSRRQPYGNCVMVAPNGMVLCRCDRKKTDWYLSRDLAEVINQDPFTIRLKFKPSGNGKANCPYYLAEKANACVCCGTKEKLTKHHCVPKCFRTYFPGPYKNHCSHDILVLCGECHKAYEPHASELKNKLAAQYGIRVFVMQESEELVAIHKAIKAAHAILRYGDQLPPARRAELSSQICEFLGKAEFTTKELDAIADRPVFNSKIGEFSLGRQIMEHITDIPQFAKMWREHFVEIMKPQFLPKYWSVDHDDHLKW